MDMSVYVYVSTHMCQEWRICPGKLKTLTSLNKKIKWKLILHHSKKCRCRDGSDVKSLQIKHQDI